MLSKRAKEIGKKLDWHVSKDSNTTFGLYRGYFFELGDGEGFKFLVTHTQEFDEETWNKLNQAIEANRDKLKISEYDIGVNGLALKFREVIRHTKKEVVIAALDFLVDLFQKSGVTYQYQCTECGSTKELGFYSMFGLVRVLCFNCYDFFDQEVKYDKKQYDSESKNYVFGTLGAAIFLIPGVIGWIILQFYFGKIAGFMAIAFGWLAFEGYTRFGGQFGSWTKWIIFGVSFLAILVSVFLSGIYEGYLAGVTFWQMLELFQSNEEIRRVTWRNLMLALLLSILPLLYIVYIVYIYTKFPRIEAAQKLT